MLEKVKVLETINDLPAVFSVEELIEKLRPVENQELQTRDKRIDVDSILKVSRNWEEIERKIMTEGKVI